jgi:hypothetical protein
MQSPRADFGSAAIWCRFSEPEVARNLEGTKVFEKASVILAATRAARFSDEPAIDLKDRLGLLTVLVGLRDVAAFGFAEQGNEGRLRELRDILNNHGVVTYLSRQIRSSSEHLPSNISAELSQVFDQVDADDSENDSGRLLWVFQSARLRGDVKRAVRGEILSGTLLAYPECCVEADRRGKLIVDAAFRKAYVELAKDDPLVLKRALKEDRPVHLALDEPVGGDVPGTDRRFPFVHHIACAACLDSEDSPSALLNAKYEQMAKEVEPNLHVALVEMAKASVEIADIADRVNKSRTGGANDREAQRRIEGLWGMRENILTDFLATT